MKKYYLMVLLISLSGILFAATNLVDFENRAEVPVLSADGDNISVRPNPDKSGINTSDSVGYYHKISGNWHYFRMTFDSAISLGYNNTLSFDVYASKQGRIFAKFWLNGEILTEAWAPEYNFMPSPNKWVRCESDISPGMGKKFDILEIAACVDQEEEAEIYFDNFVIDNPDVGDGSPFNLFTVSKSLISKGDSILFDASESYDVDGQIVEYLWDFNDGTVDTGKVLYHTFDTSGVFTVNLTIKDNDNKESTKKTDVFVASDYEKLTGLKFVKPENKTNEKIEAIFHINDTFTNVFNPDEVMVDAEITYPDGSKKYLPCFYYENSIYDKSQWTISGNLSCWMLRFSSQQTGDHKVVLTYNHNGSTEISPEYTQRVVQGEKKGSIRNDKTDPQFFRHTTGEPFYPMGINQGWDNITNYTKVINNLGQNKANIIRYWLAGFNRQSLEWTGGTYKGIGYYNQEAAAKIDSLLALCDQNDVYMQMVIFQHGMFSENVNPNWEDCAYNSANGGPIDQAEKFFYDATCNTYTKKYLRYLVARWSYSTNLFAWEFFNEVQFTGMHNSQSSKWYPGVQSWHSMMSRYVESIDPFDHIMTTSALDEMLPDFDTIRALDVVQYHLYHDELYKELKIRDDHFKENLENSSIINGEYGTNNEADVPFDIQRNLIWSSIMTQVPRFMWIWEHYLEINWAGLFEMPMTFMEGLDMVKTGDWEYSNILIPKEHADFKAIGIQSDSIYLGYIFDSKNSDDIIGSSVKLTQVPYANYKIYYYLPVENKIIVDTLHLISLQAKLYLPDFSKGIAYKIEYFSDYEKPIAIAGFDTTVSPGVNIDLSAALSLSADGNPLTYQWRIISQPALSTLTFSEENAKMEDITVVPDKDGVFKIGLKVAEGSQTSLEDTLTIYVSALPIAIAGDDVSISRDQGIIINLDGGSSYDPEGSKLTYLWEMVSKPEGSNGAIFAEDAVQSIARIDSIGEYIVTLTVNDGVVSSIPDTVKLTITAPVSIHKHSIEHHPLVYPNPFNNTIRIEIDDFEKVLCVELSDIGGRLVFKKDVEDVDKVIILPLNEQNLQQGLYILRMIYENGFYRQLVVKDK